MAGVKRVPTRQRRKLYLTMAWISALSTIVFAVAGGVLFNYALGPCPKSQFNSKGQCVPWSTIMWVLGPLFICFAAISLVWFIVVITLRHTSWYTKGNKINVEGAVWSDESRRVVEVDGKKYIAASIDTLDSEKVLVQEDKYEAL